MATSAYSKALLKQASANLPWIKALTSRYKLPGAQPGFQEKFDESDADITIAGGSAGCGKSMMLLLKSAKHISNSEYGAVIFRNTRPEITNEGGLWDESMKLFRAIPGATPRESVTDWSFASGAAISFGHTDKLQEKYPGAQIAFIGFDELTSFEEKDFWFLMSRNRTTCGVKPTISATCNPDADSWVAKLIEWWIDQETGFAIPERSGVKRYFYRIGEILHWGDSVEELAERFPDMAAIAPPKSLSFIPGSIYENKILLKTNPQYLSSLLALHPVLMERLLKGNWKVKFESGNIFKRDWFEVIDRDSLGNLEPLALTRFWDFAATDKTVATKQSSYTASLKVGKLGDTYYLFDLTAEQVGAETGTAALETTARQDGHRVRVRWELEGGSAALRYQVTLRNLLEGFDAHGIKPMGDKKTRALNWATLAYEGKVKVIRAPWNDLFFSAISQFDGSHIPMVNDVIDAISGGIQDLQNMLEFGGSMGSTKKLTASKRG